MKVFPGDVVFTSKGQPGVVKSRDPITGELRAEAEGPTFDRMRDYGIINGLAPPDREQFYGIVSELNKIEDFETRINEYTKRIEQLEPDPKNRHIVRYLNSERAHLMFSERIMPREFRLAEDRV